jgi:hypothetical protein
MSLSYKLMPSPVGDLKLIASDDGLVAVQWKQGRPQRVPFEEFVEDPAHPLLLRTEKELNEYFSGKRTAFTVPLDMRGTHFQKQVWEALLGIPFRRDSQLRPNREATRQAQRHSRRWRGEWPKPDSHHRSMPPRHRVHRFTHGLRRRTRAKRSPPQAGRTQRHLVRPTMTRQALDS